MYNVPKIIFIKFCSCRDFLQICKQTQHKASHIWRRVEFLVHQIYLNDGSNYKGWFFMEKLWIDLKRRDKVYCQQNTSINVN